MCSSDLELLTAIAGEQPWPHPVYATYWPMAQSGSFAARGPEKQNAPREAGRSGAPASRRSTSDDQRVSVTAQDGQW